MGTKTNPGEYDCYAALADDEPYFLLRANDPLAPEIVRDWVRQYRKMKVSNGAYGSKQATKSLEAEDVADAMERWWVVNYTQAK